jgi:hypothetical protein
LRRTNAPFGASSGAAATAAPANAAVRIVQIESFRLFMFVLPVI